MSTLPVDEAQTVFNDPPVVLVLRRKAIRMFPHGQSVAQYRNDNLNIDIAIPYTPGKLGKTVTRVATSEAIQEAMSDELKKIRKERGMFKRDLSRQEDRFETTKQRLDWAKRALAGHIKKHGKSLDAIGEETSADGMLGDYIHKPNDQIEAEVLHKHGHKALHHFLRAAAHYVEGDHHSANHHYQAFMRSVSEETIDELSRQTLGSYVKAASKDAADNIDKANHYTAKPIKYHREKAKKRLSGIEHATTALTKEETINELSKKTLRSYIRKASEDKSRVAGVTKASIKVYNKEETAQDDTIMEATIHSLHTINKTQHPAKVRFRDGSSAMIDHPTAAQIMKLHSKVNRLNKKKIEGLINSGPMGIRKVSTFIKDHMKD